MKAYGYLLNYFISRAHGKFKDFPYSYRNVFSLRLAPVTVNTAVAWRVT
jgi:hypothetical protein